MQIQHYQRQDQNIKWSHSFCSPQSLLIDDPSGTGGYGGKPNNQKHPINSLRLGNSDSAATYRILTRNAAKSTKSEKGETRLPKLKCRDTYAPPQLPMRHKLGSDPRQDVTKEVEKPERLPTRKRKTLHSEEPSYEIEKILDHKYDECDVCYFHLILGKVEHIHRTSMSC